ncbi:hypothetical protein [Chryseobacterium caseinilyticum]|uniref:Uncharacterized protein n=1 Tax=Chryseobacterium caseinilyticum TaxID=2771428 RepID=A0ABR8Z9D7_9FLAO|nr:hypothetical protein [Chryseobacterium caseinilyticum]MBD8081704.1 hypothetical protein [Chryseobacterium caseinilyticum]
MKLKLLILVTCIYSVQVFSQQYYGKQQSKNLPKVEFILADGSKVDAFFVGYTYPNGTYPGFFDKDDIYNFVYKKTKTSADEKFGANEVKLVKIYDDHDDVVNAIERLDMKYIDKNGQVSDKKKRSFQPMLYDGKLQIFGSNLTICTGAACNYVYSKIYIKNAKDDFAVMPVDYDKMGLFAGSLYDKMAEAFKYAGRDCPEFLKYMEQFDAKLEDKEFKKEIATRFKGIRKKAYEDAKKDKLGYNGTQELIGQYMLQAYLDFYGGIVREYEKNCPN